MEMMKEKMELSPPSLASEESRQAVFLGFIFQKSIILLPNGNIYVCLPSIANLEINYKKNNIHITKYEVKDQQGVIEENYVLSFINGKYYGYGYRFQSFFCE
jgi:hypothetical protein